MKKHKLQDPIVVVGDNILVRPDERPTKTPGGIELPDLVLDSKVQTGEVVGVGPGKPSMTGALIPSTIQVGDIVTYDRYSATAVEVEGVKAVVIKEQNIYYRKARPEAD
jgi:chaperonin GroES